MPEEKKEKFTFSDKIKNSKPAGNKSFAKSSSKIGRDGKPKATLFERTRRDAPFFIAALVALLLLPFLYKYSGQASEEQLLVPGSEQIDFDPERYGFDTAMIEDPDGQVAQLAGRDSLSLIKGFGSNEEEDYARNDMDLDASSSYEGEAEGQYAAEKHSSSEMDVEENTTNIYKRRAGRATRAAFRRTTIGTLNPAGLRRPGGSRLGINNWGGGIKGAARKVGPSGPRNAPKPVSLQPLRAVGSRSSFGRGGAEAARRSKDNMGKANPIEALRDSYVKPVDPTRVGGLDMFSTGPGGGSGKLGHTMNITPGREPWWWDMMKTRMQKEWQAKFDRKWDWIKFLDKFLQNILGGIANCLLTGDKGGDMGSMFGYGAGGGQATCCGIKAKDWNEQKYGPFGEDTCNKLKKEANFDSSIKCTKTKADGSWWDAPPSASGKSAGIIRSRLNCLGIRGRFSGEAAGSMKEGKGGLECANISNHHYDLDVSALPRDWQKHTYIYVVARNYRPDSMPPLDAEAGRGYLCTKEGISKKLNGIFKIGAKASAGGDDAQIAEHREKGQDPNNFYKTSRNSISTTKEQEIIADMYELNPESVQDACVIYIQKGDTFNYDNFQSNVVAMFRKVLADRGVKGVELEKKARDAFYDLDLMFVESFSSKYKLAYARWFETGNNLHDILPMVYWRFHDAFVKHRGSTNKATGSRINVDNRKPRVIGVDTAMGTRCYFDESIKLECFENEEPKVIVRFGQRYKGGQPHFAESYKNTSREIETDMETKLLREAENIRVTAQFKPLDGKPIVEQPMDRVKPFPTEDYKGLIYTFTDAITKDGKGSLKGKYGNIVWKVYRKGSTGVAQLGDEAGKTGEESVYTLQCPYDLSGDGDTIIVDSKPCPNGPQTSKKCCEEVYGPQDSANDYKWEGGKCVITPKKIEQGKYTVFAPQISCVPDETTDRKAVTDSISCDLFGKSLVSKYKTQGQSCHDLFGFVMDSNQATTFVNRVKEAYNAKHPDLPIVFAKQYPQDSEFIDALNIAPTVGVNDVSVAAVCELGRDFVRMSKDKHAGNRSIQTGETGTKQEDLIFRNELGAFLAYIHDTSILYPDAHVRYNGKTTCDWRFQPYHVTDGGCDRNLGPKMGKAYAHNNYNGTDKGNKYATFRNSLTPIMRQTPLKALANGKDLPHECGNCKSVNGKNYVKEYNSYNGFAGLLHEESGINGRGEACEAYLGDSKNVTMSVAEALQYIEGLCTAGLDYKPHGVGSTQFSSNQSPTTTGGQSGKDEITSQRM